MSTSQDMSEQEMWNELVSFVGNEYGAAGIMGNLCAESNLNSTNLQNTYENSLGMSDEEYTRRVDNGTYSNFVHDEAGYGLAQWTWHSRKENLLNYANSTGSSIGSTKMQLAFLEKELSENYSSTLSSLQNANSVQEASDIFMTQFENPADQSSSAKANRAANGEGYYNQYSGTSSVDSSSSLATASLIDAEASALSDVTIDIQVDNLKDICTSWNQSVTQVDLASVNVKQSFLALTDCDVAVSYIPSLENALSQIASLVTSVCEIIQTAGDEQAAIDDNFYTQTGTSTDSGYNSSGSNGGGSNTNYGGGDSSSISSGGGFVSSNPTTSVDNSNLNVTINTDMIDTIKGLDFNSYNNFMTSLASIVTDKVSLTTYLSNSAYASVLKTSLLEAKSSPDSLKKIIADMDSNVLQATLYALMTDTTVVTDISKSVMYTYLEQLANQTNLSLTDMFKNQDSLVKIFTEFNEVSKVINNVILSDKMNQTLVDIYDGNSISGISSSNITLIRGFIDKIATNKNITAEALLTDSSNSSYLNQSFQEIGKAYKYIGSIGYTDLNTASSILNNIFKTS